MSGEQTYATHLQVPYYRQGLFLTPLWLSYYIHDKIWDELLIHSQTSTATPESRSDYAPQFTASAYDNTSPPGFKLNQVDKRGPNGQSPMVSDLQIDFLEMRKTL